MKEAMPFNKVFHKMKMPEPLASGFKNAMVRDVVINQKSHKLCIEMELDEICDEACVDGLCRFLSNKYLGIDKVEVELNYRLEGLPEEKRLERFWPNLVLRLARDSSMYQGLLKNAKWQLADNVLTVDIPKNGKFIFAQYNIDRKIERILGSIGMNVNVTFNEVEVNLSKPRFTPVTRSDAPSQGGASGGSSPGSTGSSSSGNTAGSFKAASTGGRKKFNLRPRLDGVVTQLAEPLEENDEILISGEIFRVESRETRSGKLLFTFDVYDMTNSITIKMFVDKDKFSDELKNLLQPGNGVKVLGRVQYDSFSKEINIMAREMAPHQLEKNVRMDNAPQKRVELHLHTNMSSMDAITPAKKYVKRAIEWGHRAIAITDHGAVQAFPEAMETARGSDLKVIYGVEAYLVEDMAVTAVWRDGGLGMDNTYVVFDFETTGLSKETCTIIEIGAVKVKNGEVIDRYSMLINPGKPLPPEIVELTSITDAMLKGKPSVHEVLPDFLEFISGCVLVAHNAPFDVGFLEAECERMGLSADNPYICTVETGRILFPDLRNHKLNTLAKHLGISLEHHHRAVDDAEATAHIFVKFLELLEERGVNTLADINVLALQNVDIKKLRPRHAIILVKNLVGLRNLYELVSLSHINYFYRKPLIPKSELVRLREGLLVGTACEAGEFYLAVREGASEKRLQELAEFYDYYEIQPLDNNMYLVREGKVADVERLRNINRKIVEYGELYNKPVVATCDCHFIDPEQEIYRRVLQAAEKFKDADNQPPLYFRTTEEMLEEFAYLGADKAFEVVVTNTNLIADMIEAIKPIPDGTFPPFIEGAEEEIRKITMEKAHEIYGDPLPPLVADRLDRELQSIIKNGFSVMYIIAQKLVWDSVAHGYLVGSRGSVGSSFVATMAGITEVNPLPPHYYCPECKYSDFDSDEVKAYVGASGCDMPDKECPVCGHMLKKEGHDIPFETFLGFDGDKEPDIDLNFSGEYQAKAHAYTEELFGEGHVFKAGTIGTLAEKTAYGFVKKYLDERERTERNAEINRLVAGCTGVKRTTGQHPGGLMIVPEGHSIYEFCPIQHPANDAASGVKTTHFDYHSISGRLLKLDILGHDVPTIIRMLHDDTGIDPCTVDLGDKDVMSLFTSPEKLGVTTEEIQCQTGSLGLPEFGTRIVRQMLIDTQPSTFAELVRISGLSHGTDVYFNNAQDLIKDGIVTLKEVIPTRDDIMIYLINKGVEKLTSFKIMENVRKGKGLRDDEVKLMQEAGVPEWYIESCRRIKYMFPKGHAVAYVMMTVRIGYFKIHYPYAFYAAMFTVKRDDFDYEKMCKGKDIAYETMRAINVMGNDATAKDKSMLTVLELVYEMYARGLTFLPIDIYKSAAERFIVTEDGLLPPLCSIPGLGGSAAATIVEAREQGEFFSVDDLRERTKVNKTVTEIMRENGILKGIPDTAQLSLFT